MANACHRCNGKKTIKVLRKQIDSVVARGQLYVSCEPEEVAVPLAVETLGDHFIMYASDYPHWDSDFPNTTKPMRERRDISDAVRAKIMGGNAARFYALAA